jgi:hypothetical protein
VRVFTPQVLRTCLAVASFFIYAISALQLAEVQATSNNQDYACERRPIAAAISNIVYDAPLGAIYNGILAKLDYQTTPIAIGLKEVVQGDIKLGSLISNNDGTGYGFLLFTTEALRIFGVSIQSFILGFRHCVVLPQ